MNNQSKVSNSKYKNFSLVWILLSALFALQMIVQLDRRVEPSKPNKEVSKQFIKQELELERTLSLKYAFSLTNGLDEKEIAEVNRNLDDSISAMIDYRAKYPKAALLYVIMRYEQGKKILEKDLGFIRKSKNKQFQLLAEIYSQDSLTKPEAESYISQLKGEKFYLSVVKAHLLEKSGEKNIRPKIFPISKWMLRGFAIMAFFFVGVIGIFVWRHFLNNRKKVKYKPKGHPVSTKDHKTADNLGMRVLVMLLTFNVVPLLTISLLKPYGDSLAMGATYFLLGPMILWGLYIKLDGKQMPIKKLLGSTKKVKDYAKWGVSAAFANIPLVVFMGLLGSIIFQFFPEPSHPAADRLAYDRSVWTLIVTYFMGCIFAPIIEEIIFRGLLFPALTKKFDSVWIGALVSSLLFAAIHPQGLQAWPALAAIGGMGCFLTYQTKSLLPAIVMHTLHNFIMITFTLIML